MHRTVSLEFASPGTSSHPSLAPSRLALYTWCVPIAGTVARTESREFPVPRGWRRFRKETSRHQYAKHTWSIRKCLIHTSKLPNVSYTRPQKSRRLFLDPDGYLAQPRVRRGGHGPTGPFKAEETPWSPGLNRAAPGSHRSLTQPPIGRGSKMTKCGCTAAKRTERAPLRKARLGPGHYTKQLARRFDVTKRSPADAGLKNREAFLTRVRLRAHAWWLSIERRIPGSDLRSQWQSPTRVTKQEGLASQQSISSEKKSRRTSTSEFGHPILVT